MSLHLTFDMTDRFDLVNLQSRMIRLKLKVDTKDCMFVSASICIYSIQSDENVHLTQLNFHFKLHAHVLHKIKNLDWLHQISMTNVN